VVRWRHDRRRTEGAQRQAGPADGTGTIRAGRYNDYRGAEPLGDVWTLTQGAHAMRCALTTHPLGWKLRLTAGSTFLRSQVCKTEAAVFAIRSRDGAQKRVRKAGREGTSPTGGDLRNPAAAALLQCGSTPDCARARVPGRKPSRLARSCAQVVPNVFEGPHPKVPQHRPAQSRHDGYPGANLRDCCCVHSRMLAPLNSLHASKEPGSRTRWSIIRSNIRVELSGCERRRAETELTSFPRKKV
jgi:hypothetical protein